MVCWTSVCCMGEGEEGYFEHVAVGELDVLAGEVVIQQEDAAWRNRFVFAGGIFALAVGGCVGGFGPVVVFGFSVIGLAFTEDGLILSIDSFVVTIVTLLFTVDGFIITIISFALTVDAITLFISITISIIITTSLREKKNTPREDARGRKEVVCLEDETLLLRE